MRNLEKLSDNELMELGQNGKKDKAFTILYNRYNENLEKFCLGKTKNEELAKEISQETFLRLYSSWNTYKKMPDSTFKTWLFKIAMNRYIDYIRKEAQMPTECFSDVLKKDFYNDEIVQLKLFNNYFDEGFEKALDKKERNCILRQIIKKKLKQSKPRYFKLIDMAYLKEFTYEEIAKKLGIPMGTVKAQLFRARNLIHEELVTFKSL